MLYLHMRRLIDKMHQEHLDQRSKLLGMLEVFYKERTVNSDCIIILDGYRLHSKGGRKDALEMYQEELKAFTEFLKSHLASG